MVENLVNAVCKLAGIPVPKDKSIVPFLWDRKEEIRVEVEPSTGFIRIFPTAQELEKEGAVVDYILKGDDTQNCVMAVVDEDQKIYGEIWGHETRTPTMLDFANKALLSAPPTSILILFALAGKPPLEGRLTYRATA